MTDGQPELSKQAALSRILQVALAKLGAAVLYTCAILGMAALIPGLELPGVLGNIAAGIGVEAMGSIIDRVTKRDKISDDEIAQQVRHALEQSNIDQLLTKDDFWHAFAHLRGGQRSLSDQKELIFKILRRIERVGASDVAVVDGTHHAEGIGNIVGIDAQGPVIFRPGTKSTAAGIGTVTATRIGSKKESSQ